MKDVLNLLYFVFAFISAYGVIGLINDLTDNKPFEDLKDIIFHIAKGQGFITILEVGIVGLIGTFIYSKVFL